MPDFTVTWVIDVFDVEDEVEAARQARNIQQDRDCLAHAYEVADFLNDSSVVRVDLDKLEEEA